MKDNTCDLIEPLISIYIPTKNRRELLERAVRSIQEQHYKNIEILICSDGSTDTTVDFGKELDVNYKNITFFHNDTSMGACYSRNRAIKASKGEYITGLDDDDYFLPCHIKRLVSELTGNKKTILFVTQNVKKNNVLVKNSPPAKVNLESLVRGNIIGNQVFAHRSLYFEAGLFSENLPAWQDYDLWLKMGKINSTFKCVDTGTYVVDIDHPHERITKNSKNIDIAFNIFKEQHSDIFGGNKEKFLIASYLRYASVRLSFSKLLNLMKFFDFLLMSRVLYSRYRKLVKR